MNRRFFLKSGLLTGVYGITFNSIPNFETTINYSDREYHFYPSGQNEIKEINVRNKKFGWGDHYLKIHCEYEKGDVNLSNNKRAKVLKYIQDSLSIELISKIDNKIVDKPPAFFDQFNIEPGFNCFGYCFTNGIYWIDDPLPFIESDYIETSSKNADIIIFKSFDGYGDNFNEIYNYIHVVKILSNGNVSFKPGINELIENVDISKAKHDYNFNHKIYYKKI